MTTLKATAAASQALNRRKIEERAAIVRGRVEAKPGAGLLPKMSSVENRIQLLHYEIATGLLDEIDEALVRHDRALEEAAMAAAGQAQAQLLAERGVETFDTGSVKSRDGWVWLKTRTPPRLSSHQISTGDRFSALYRAAHRDTLSTASNDNGGESKVDSIDALREARASLGRIAKHIEHATGSERLFDLLANVCGRGETLRGLCGGDERQARDCETELRLALDMAGAAFKMGGRREEAA